MPASLSLPILVSEPSFLHAMPRVRWPLLLYWTYCASICPRTLSKGTATPATSSAAVHTSNTWARAPLVIITLPSGPAARMERRLRRKS